MDLEFNERQYTKEQKVESLNIARRICLFNSETMHYVKNALLMMDLLKQNELKGKYDKLETIIKSNYPRAEVLFILANYTNNSNHNITMLDVNSIQDMLLEGLIDPNDKTNTLGGSGGKDEFWD